MCVLMRTCGCMRPYLLLYTTRPSETLACEPLLFNAERCDKKQIKTTSTRGTGNEDQTTNETHFKRNSQKCLSFVRRRKREKHRILTHEERRKSLTYFGVGRISWPFLYHFSSTVGSARSTTKRIFPPLSTWYAGSNFLAKALSKKTISHDNGYASYRKPVKCVPFPLNNHRLADYELNNLNP